MNLVCSTILVDTKMMFLSEPPFSDKNGDAESFTVGRGLRRRLGEYRMVRTRRALREQSELQLKMRKMNAELMHRAV